MVTGHLPILYTMVSFNCRGNCREYVNMTNGTNLNTAHRKRSIDLDYITSSKITLVRQLRPNGNEAREALRVWLQY